MKKYEKFATCVNFPNAASCNSVEFRFQSKQFEMGFFSSKSQPLTQVPYRGGLWLNHRLILLGCLSVYGTRGF